MDDATGDLRGEDDRPGLCEIPLPEAHVDAVISNCVINLSADKPRALAGAFRVLRPGGGLSVSDVLASGDADLDERVSAAEPVRMRPGGGRAG